MKEKTILNESKSKGELNMKRTIVILALVTAFVLAFTAVAQATWRGFTPVRTQAQLDAGMMNGFITFGEARLEMARNLNVGGNFRAGGAFADFGHNAAEAAGLQGTAHGGYVTTTTLCVTCHSVHRATGVINPDGDDLSGLPGFGPDGVPLAGNANRDLRNRNQAFLTAGASTCLACHTVHGSGTSSLLVEWGTASPGYSSGGPHGAPRRGCLLCHNAGIHGLGNSRFNVMNSFLLGNTRGTGTQALIPPPGWVAPPGFNVLDPDTTGWVLSGGPAGLNNTGVSRDDLIEAEMHLWTGPDSRNQVLMEIPDGNPRASTWWADGIRFVPPMGGFPGIIPNSSGVGNVNVGPAIWSAARSMATAYTCGEAGCHTTGAFFLNNWGVGFSRADSVRTPANGMSRIGDVQVTGHSNPGTRGYTGSPGNCGPCHAGGPAGFPTASTNAGFPDNTRRAYGCDQCHDMVGVATNTTAWPHGNRHLYVYEWTAAGQQQENWMVAGNLWMYAGNIARSADAPMITDNNSAQVGGDSNVYRGPNSINPWFADQSWFVMTNVGSGRYGVPANVDDNTNPAANRVQNVGTGLIDGSCLKCHVAIDADSLRVTGSVAADAIRHTWNQGTTTNPTWNGNPVSGSQRLFLYR